MPLDIAVFFFTPHLASLITVLDVAVREPITTHAISLQQVER